MDLDRLSLRRRARPGPRRDHHRGAQQRDGSHGRNPGGRDDQRPGAAKHFRPDHRQQPERRLAQDQGANALIPSVPASCMGAHCRCVVCALARRGGATAQSWAGAWLWVFVTGTTAGQSQRLSRPQNVGPGPSPLAGPRQSGSCPDPERPPRRSSSSAAENRQCRTDHPRR